MISSFQTFFSLQKPIEGFAQKIELTPGNVTLSRGGNITIKVGNPFEKAEYHLFIKYEDLWRSEVLPEKQKTISNIDSNFSYYIKNQWASSDTFAVLVFEDPNIKKISLQYFYPAYINKKTDYIENSDGMITIPQFTEVEIVVQTPATVSEANIVFADRSFLKMENNGRDTWVVRVKPSESTHYHFSLIDQLGTTNQIVTRNINIIKDQPPSIAFVYPAKDTLMTQNNLFEVRLTASDDYGLRNLRIFTQIKQNTPTDTLIFRNSSLNFINLSHIFDFRAAQLFPGDEIEYWAEVYDNSPLNQKATTKRFKLKFPSIEEIFRRFEKEEEERSNILSNLLDESREMQKEFDLKRREFLRKEQVNWDDQKALQKFIDDQKTMNEMVENVANNYDAMRQQMEMNETVSRDILEKMQKIQEIMDQISTEDLRKAMENLQQSMENMNTDDLRKAMQDFQFNMQDFADKLQQTLKLLEEIKNEQNLDRQLEIAKEMMNMQEDLHNRTENAQDTSALSEEQQRISDKLQALQEQMQKTMGDLASSGNQDMAGEMQEMMQDMEDSQLSENLSDATDAMQKNEKQKASEKQKQSLKQMAKMVSKMEQMKSDMSGAGMQEMIEAIQQTIYKLILIAKEHQQKVQRIGNDPLPFVPGFISDFESVQLTISQLYNAPQVMLVLGQKFFYDLNETIKAYRELFSDVQNSRFHTHKKHTATIQSGLNLLVFDLMQALNNMEQSEGEGEGQGGSGMQSLMQSLQQMSGQQMAMNMMTQGMMEQLSQQGNRMSNQMREQLQEMANEEQRMADNLQRMLHTNPDAQKHANTLKEIAQEMNDVAQRLRQNRVDKNLFDKQNNIMSRLIEVQRSINKRDRSNQRQGETANDQLWELPADIDLNLNNITDRKLLEDEMQKLPLEYRQIILEYLRRVNE
ncbi:MAG: DUF4175 domain-containing protein [Candidatus Cloacimonetes bacterium]|nr:DUF4175 domain-containing protein [Candidatus Cloacimonadota bacterium]